MKSSCHLYYRNLFTTNSKSLQFGSDATHCTPTRTRIGSFICFDVVSKCVVSNYEEDKKDRKLRAKKQQQKAPRGGRLPQAAVPFIHRDASVVASYSSSCCPCLGFLGVRLHLNFYSELLLSLRGKSGAVLLHAMMPCAPQARQGVEKSGILTGAAPPSDMPHAARRSWSSP